MATQVDVADAWLPIPDLSNDEWRDFQKLFGVDGPHGDDLLADLEASLNSMTAPEAMELDTNLEHNWSPPPNTSDVPTHSLNDVKQQQEPQNFLEDDLDAKQGNPDQCRAPSEQCTKEKQTKRRQPRISREARETLEGYYMYNPYPSAGQLKVLSDQTQLDVKKIRNWFSNTRSRHPDQIPVTQRLNRGSHSQEPKLTQIASRQNNSKSPSYEQDQTKSRRRSNRLSKDSLDRLSQEFPSNQQQPLDAWMSSPTEPVGVAAIEAAVATRHSEAYSSDLPSQSPATSLFSRAASRAASSAGSAATRATKYSMSSRGSNISAFSMRSRRKGRKRIGKLKTEPYPKQGSLKQTMEAYQSRKAASAECLSLPEPTKYCEEKKYFCTFCDQRFKNLYEWRRHEESIHVMRSTWVCCSTLESPFAQCPFCFKYGPGEEHLAQHGYYTCKAQPEEARTFFRKDHFQQHLHNMHLPKHKHPDARTGCSKGSNFGCNSLIERWIRPAPVLARDDPALHCGFCGDWLSTWEERCRHVARHFSPFYKDLSSWWQERLPNTLQDTWNHLHRGRLRCRYCYKVFNAGDWSHESCQVWSCRFLRDINALTDDNDIRNQKHGSCYISMAHGTSIRDCTQDFYSTYDDFIHHLQIFHGAIESFQQDEVYTQLEKNYCRIKKAVFEPAYDGSFLLSPGPQGHVPAPTQALSTDHKIELSQAPPLAAPLPSYNFFPPLDSQTQPQTWKADCTVSQAPAPLAQRPMLVTSIEPTQHTAHSSQLPSPARLSAVSRTSRTSIHPTNLPKDIPPRFFIGFRSFLSEFPTIFYLKGGSAGAPSRPWNILGPTEIEKGYIATLMMSSGLVGMASQGLGSSISHDGGSGWVGFGAEEQGAEFARAVEVM